MQPNDDEALAAQLLQTPDAHERAALLGIDYDRLTAADRQLRRGSNIVSGVFAVVCGVACALIFVAGEYPLFSWGSLLGVAVSFVAALLPLIILSLVFQAPLMRLMDPLRQQVIGGAAISALWALLYFATVVLCPVDWHAGLAIGFALSTTLLSLSGAQSLRIAIAKNHPKLLMGVRQQQAMPPHFTLLGYDARWLLTCFAWGFVESTGVALLIAFAPISVIPVIVVRAAVTAVETRVGWTNARRGMAVVAVESSVFLLAGIVVAIVVAA